MSAEEAGLEATPPDSADTALLNGKASDGSSFPPIRKTGCVVVSTSNMLCSVEYMWNTCGNTCGNMCGNTCAAEGDTPSRGTFSKDLFAA